MSVTSFESDGTQQHCLCLEGPNSETLKEPLHHLDKPIFLRAAHCSPPQMQELPDCGGYPNYNEFMKNEAFPSVSHFSKTRGCMTLKLTRFCSPCGPNISDVGYSLRGEFDIIDKFRLVFIKSMARSNQVGRQGYDDVHFIVPKPVDGSKTWPQASLYKIFRQDRENMPQTYYINSSQYTHNYANGACAFENSPIVSTLAAISILNFQKPTLNRRPKGPNNHWHRGWVLDSMAGSGGYGLLCLLMGYNVVFTEINGSYLNKITPIAKKIMSLSESFRLAVYLALKRMALKAAQSTLTSKERQKIETGIRIHNIFEE